MKKTTRRKNAARNVKGKENLVSPAIADTASADSASPQRALPEFWIVGIGASAGGLEACTQLLQNLPSSTGMAFVLIQHLYPKHESVLSQILQASAQIQVVEAEDGMPIEPGRLHVIPPNAVMTIIDGRLHLTPRPAERAHIMPVDLFFRSLAEYAQDRAVGIILSGTASDGAAGLREIKAAEGITIVQEPQSARFDGMPRAAIATGAADLILPPDKMAEELERIARHPIAPAERAIRQPAEPDVHEEHLARIFLMLRNASSVDFTHYKRPTIIRRLQRRMVLRRIGSYPQYIDFLQRTPQEVASLYQDLLIHVTRFFREPDSFTALAEQVFPGLLQGRDPDQPIRIWVPGCSTGEEPYSLAMTLLEFLGDRAGITPVQLFATDVSEHAIEQARAGVYPESIAADVSAERLRRFFSKSDTGFRIAKSVRDLCVFAHQDLTRDPPFSRLDLIVCRNVLIYLGPVLQKRLMNVFHYGLKPSGHLMLGSAESVGVSTDLFAIVDKRHKIYSKRVNITPGVDYPATGYSQHARMDAAAKLAAPSRSSGNVQSEANRILLARYTPPGVIVDDHLQIIQFRGQTGLFLEPAPGDASLNVLKMAREGLLYGLRTAIAEARKTESTVRKEGLRVRQNGSSREVSIEIVPLLGISEGRHFLVLFREAASVPQPAPAPAPAKPATRKADAREKVELIRLQEELAANREHLQAIIQDMEAANEELQSANEEILSSNEELQSTNEELDTAKEELQSTNEELNTLNEELHGRNDELSRVNGDLLNLLSSVQIAIVMVAGDLRIRRFTPTAERVLNLIPTDIGRPISDIKPNIDCPELERLIGEAIDTVTIRQRQVQDRSGRWYSLQIRPYKNVDNRIDGAVLVLFDAEEAIRRVNDQTLEARHAANYGEAVFHTVREPLLVLDAGLHIKDANRAFYSTFGVNPAETLNRLVYELGGGTWNQPALRTLLEVVLPDNRIFEGFAVECAFPGIGKRRMMLSGRRIAAGEGRPALILLAIEDVTSRQDAR